MSSPPKGGSNTTSTPSSKQENSKKASSKSQSVASKRQLVTSNPLTDVDGNPGPSTSTPAPPPKTSKGTSKKEDEDNNRDNSRENSRDSSRDNNIDNNRDNNRDNDSSATPHNNNNRSNPKDKEKSCCFCWCCCCSCSCLSVHNQMKERALRMHHVGPSGPSGPPSGPSGQSADGYVNGAESDAPPTIEEIRSWSESFDRLMRCAAGRQCFRDFLRCEYSEENILFWLACEELKREKSPEVVEEKARSIYEDYVSILSPKEVSLDSKVRDVVNRNMVHPTKNTFDEAQLQIYTLMHRDSYPRFLTSPLYRRVAQLPSPPQEPRKTSICVG